MLLLPLIAMSTLIPQQSFRVQGDHFELNGKPFVVRSGEMHYPRVPEQYWRHRFKQARAMGLNTICTYVFWNLHERTPGKFDFKGNLDLGKYIQIAQEEGLYMIVRPGPYVCTELDFGGFPAWLLKDRSMTVRTNDPKYLGFVERYIKAVGKVVKPHLLKNGGNVILAQVENEYGSYGANHEYMDSVRRIMIKAGFDCQLFTSDGPGQGMLSGGTLPDLPPTVNFGGGAENAFAELAKFRPNTPRMIGEYWCGWFDHWGKGHHTTSPTGHVKDIQWCLTNNVSFNLYMFHGGTNWGFMQGSNGGGNDFNVDTTSYDYDSPLDESGKLTPKFKAFRDAILASGVQAPEPVEDPVSRPIDRFLVNEVVSLFDNLPTPVHSERLQTFEDLDQAHGLILYRTTSPVSGTLPLQIDRLMDYALVRVDGVQVGVLDRRKQQKQIEITVKKGSKIELLVEALSRVNFGGLIPTERKGIDGKVSLGGKELKAWDHILLPLDNPRSFAFGRQPTIGPALYRGHFEVSEPADTFLDLRGWNKGFVWVNGVNLGRFWKIGPQQTLYLPGVWMKKGRNEVIIYDEGGIPPRWSIAGLAKPILDQAEIDRSRLLRKAGQVVTLPAQPTAQGSLDQGTKTQLIALPADSKGRYFAFESLSEHKGEPFAAIAELNAQAPDGKDWPRTGWKVLYADSEEVDSENGSALNVLDNQPTTFWHTEWGNSQPKHPHVVIIDFGQELTVSSIRYLPRQEGVNGRIKDFRVYLSTTPFKGL
ncbi:MAG: beta-galactosidase [Fimbriimonadaceae bacterium]